MAEITTGAIFDYAFTGAPQTVTLIPGRYKLECWGAQGGWRSGESYGGKGGYSVGTLTVNKATTLHILVGGSGKTGNGYNGGGIRATGYPGGGGATDIRIESNDLLSRVIVAGGGGSDGSASKAGGYGGGESGQARTDNYGTGGYAGTQTGVSSTSWQTTEHSTATAAQADAYAGFGFGGNGISRSSGYGGAGGGGWYGGSGSYPDGSGDDDRGGGGGSGFVWTGANAPEGFKLTEEHYLADASTTAGGSSFAAPAGGTETGHSGDGYARITAVEVFIQPPESLTITQLEDGKVDLTWPAVTGAVGYRLYRDGSLVADTALTSAQDTLTPLVTNTYSLKAYDNVRESDALVKTFVYKVPPDSERYFYKNQMFGGVLLKWGEVIGATGYRLYRDGTLLTSTTGLSYRDNDISPNNTYSYSLVPFNKVGGAVPTTLTVEIGELWLITDRTSEHVNRISELASLIKQGKDSIADYNEFLSGERGSYKDSDLNRVGEAIQYLADILNGYGYKVTVTPKTDWDGTETLQDKQVIRHYLDQVQIIRGVLDMPAGSPEVPADFEGLTYEEANDIERILEIVESSIQRLMLSWFYSDEVFCGEV